MADFLTTAEFSVYHEWEGYTLIRGVFGPKINVTTSEFRFRFEDHCQTFQFELSDWEKDTNNNKVRFRFQRHIHVTLDGEECSYAAVFEGTPKEAEFFIEKIKDFAIDYISC
jgi:hypothetical protein